MNFRKLTFKGGVHPPEFKELTEKKSIESLPLPESVVIPVQQHIGAPAEPVVEVGESLGYLPGDLEQKISPYLRPLYDAMEALIPFESIRSLEENRVIEIAPLGYMRGRTLADAFVILDEAQNTTREQMMMFLTRLGEGSKAVITGDITQIDLPKREDSGLLHTISVLNSIRRIRFIFFSEKDVVRNSLVREIVRAYENETEKK